MDLTLNVIRNNAFVYVCIVYFSRTRYALVFLWQTQIEKMCPSRITAAVLMTTIVAIANATTAARDPPGFQSIAFPSKELHKFRSKAAPNGYFHARIPAVVLAGKVLVAMGECARCVNQGCNSYVGWSADICSKRSFDDGLTWNNFTVIAVRKNLPVYNTFCVLFVVCIRVYVACNVCCCVLSFM